MEKRHLRREYYIYREIQLKYIRLTLLLMLLVCTIMGYTIYTTSWGILVKRLSVLCPAENIKEIYGFFNSTLVITLLLMVPVIVVATMYLSHRVAGPVFRIEKDLNMIAQGDLTRRITLRKNDDLKKLAAEINRAIGAIDSLLFNTKNTLSELEKALREAIAEGAAKEDTRLKLEKCLGVLEKISRELARFKTGK